MLRNKPLIFSLLLFAGVVHSGLCDDLAIPCLYKINVDSDFQKNLSEIVGENELNQTFVDNNRDDFFELFFYYIRKYCYADYKNLDKLAATKEFDIPFTLGIENKQDYIINIESKKFFSTERFERTAFLVAPNELSKHPGDTIKNTELPEDWFWTTKCSTRSVNGRGVYASEAVATAGRAAFSEYNAQTDNRTLYFLDPPLKHNNRFFPGLILTVNLDNQWGSKPPVSYTNYQTSYNRFQTFATKLQSAGSDKCAGLAVYHVRIPADTNSAFNEVSVLADPVPIQ